MCVCVCFLNKPEEILTLRAVVSPDATFLSLRSVASGLEKPVFAG